VVYHLATRAFRNRPKALDLLATGIPANPTTQISLGIEDLAGAAGPLRAAFLETSGAAALLARLEREPGGPEWQSRLEDFLRRFGHRGPMEFDLGATRWSEDPSMILELVRARVAAPGKEGIGERMERLGGERQRALEEAYAASPFWKRPYLKLMARLVRLYMPLREAPKHYGMVLFTRSRRCALELGRRLADRGVLERTEDVFFLEMRELVEAVQGGRPPEETRALIPGRRALHERFLREKAPDFLRSDGVPVQEEAPSGRQETGTLLGTAVSAGRASGPVKVLQSPDPSAVTDGDVLVMVFADPGWTPLFPGASAVVMEVGGAMCHAAVVAREMGIPAVFGVPGATSLLKNGQRVTVDGSSGTVVLEGE
jgi:pyruvate,water dikinase